MRSFFALSFLILGLILVPTVPVEAAVFRYNDQDYVPIAGWARANKFSCHWLKHGDLFEVTGRTTRLVFDVDSHYADINGVQVALSFPIANQKGVALIAQFDLAHTVRPLLFPSLFLKPDPIKTICLDPGHGGRDSGNRVRWHAEKTYTLLLGFDLREELQKDGFKVIMTRTRDVYVGLPERAAFANRHHADLFVSLHFNSSPTDKDQVKGPQTYCITPVGASSTDAQGKGANSGPTPANRDENESLWLAYQVQKSLVQTLHLDDRGVRRARYQVLRDARMPAILVESGYMSNPTEGKKIYTPAYRHALARAMAKGIVAYQRLTSPPSRSASVGQKSKGHRSRNK